MSESIRELLAREAAEAEEHAAAEARGEVPAPPGKRASRKASDPSQVYPVRIPVARLNELRKVAEGLGVPPTSLIRQWVIERLDDMSRDLPDETGRVVRLGAESLAPNEIRLGPRRHIERGRRGTIDSVTQERRHA
jgi:hypothetical protein